MDVRRHPITGEPILFAPERSGRPNAFGPEDHDVCPFCPGNESLTPPALEETGAPWRIRVFPNKYPAVDGHEVIVESRRHDDTFETLEDPAAVIRTWIGRYRAHGDARCVALFKNEGERAGASLEHIHSQVMPLSFIPPRVQRHLDAFRAAKACPLCAAIGMHRREGLIVAENDSFVAFAPAGSQHAYEQWIAPLRHHEEITGVSDGGIDHLALILQRSTAAARTISPAQNIIAGFELGSGTFIDIVDPELAAERLRGSQ